MYVCHSGIPTQTFGWELDFMKFFLWGGSQEIQLFSFVKRFLWVGKFGWEGKFSDFSVGGGATRNVTLCDD